MQSSRKIDHVFFMIIFATRFALQGFGSTIAMSPTAWQSIEVLKDWESQIGMMLLSNRFYIAQTILKVYVCF